jgi:hypothetical protein
LLFLALLAACSHARTIGDAGPPDGPVRLDGGDEVDGHVDPPDGCMALRETCNGDDDDCDGLVDEGAGSTLGCGAALCTGGACVCPAERMCGGECVDIERARDHCGSCGVTCPPSEACVDGICCVPRTDPVDLLFMVDNSNSMAEEQASLAASFPRMLDVLTAGDLDGDGAADFPAVTDMHVGVVTSDMGTGGARVPTCNEPSYGDDGILRRTPGSLSGCDPTYPAFLTYTAPGSTATLAADFGCVATTGTGGCGFEQQLDAALKALTPAASPLRFQLGSPGNGDGPNAGFLRAGSVLAVVLVTDEEDCSASDPELFDPGSSTYGGDLNLRCFNHPSAVHPVSRYVDGFLALRSDPADLIFTLVGGVPPDLVVDPARPDYLGILADERMVEMIDPIMPTRLRPSCDVPGRGQALPPRRMVETARQLDEAGAGAVVQSICQADLTAAMRAIANRIAASVASECL